MPTGLERISAGMYADNLIAAGTHYADGDGNALRRLSFPEKIMAPSLDGIKKGKRKRRRAIGQGGANGQEKGSGKENE